MSHKDNFGMYIHVFQDKKPNKMIKSNITPMPCRWKSNMVAIKKRILLPTSGQQEDGMISTYDAMKLQSSMWN